MASLTPAERDLGRGAVPAWYPVSDTSRPPGETVAQKLALLFSDTKGDLVAIGEPHAAAAAIARSLNTHYLDPWRALPGRIAIVREAPRAHGRWPVLCQLGPCNVEPIAANGQGAGQRGADVYAVVDGDEFRAKLFVPVAGGPSELAYLAELIQLPACRNHPCWAALAEAFRGRYPLGYQDPWVSEWAAATGAVHIPAHLFLATPPDGPAIAAAATGVAVAARPELASGLARARAFLSYHGQPHGGAAAAMADPTAAAVVGNFDAIAAFDAIEPDVGRIANNLEYYVRCGRFMENRAHWRDYPFEPNWPAPAAAAGDPALPARLAESPEMRALDRENGFQDGDAAAAVTAALAEAHAAARDRAALAAARQLDAADAVAAVPGAARWFPPDRKSVV